MHTTFETLSAKQDGDVLNVTLNRPQRANAINRQMMADLAALSDELDGRDEIGFMVLYGGDDVFSAGADLKELAGDLSSPPPHRGLRSMHRLGREAISKLESVEQTVIAALRGSAYGAGMAIALTADYRVMADTAVANMPETKIGLFLTYGCTPRLVNLIGPARTQEFIDFAEDISATKCLEWGMVTETVPVEDVDARVGSMIERLRSRERSARRVTKKIIRAACATVGDVTTGEDEIFEGTVALGTVENEVKKFVNRSSS